MVDIYLVPPGGAQTDVILRDGTSATTQTNVNINIGGLIKSIQSISITIGAGASTNTYTLPSPVIVANALLVYQGSTATETNASSGSNFTAYVTLTNTNTITATRQGTTNAITASAVVVEFNSGVNSIQYGTVAIGTSGTSATATLTTSVGANAFVLWLGSAGNGNYIQTSNSVQLTNSTTVTGFIGQTSLNSQTIGFVVADLDSTIVSTVQKRAFTNATSATSYTDTISNVTPNNTLLFYNGTTTGSTIANVPHTLQLTDATTVTLTRGATSTTTRTIYYTVVQFTPSALNGSIQRNVITETSRTSNTATINSTNTVLSFCNWAGFQGAATTPATALTTLALTNATTITETTNTASSQTVSYEVIQFSAVNSLFVQQISSGKQIGKNEIVLSAETILPKRTIGKNNILIQGYNAWNPNDNTGLTLSNSNYTEATFSTGVGVRTNYAKTKGRWYFEVTFDVLGGTGNQLIGVCTGSASFATLDTLCRNGRGVYSGTGNIWINGIKASGNPSLGAFANGDILAVAVNLDSNLIWFRKNLGNWNADVIANQNPETTTGGINISGLTPPLYPFAVNAVTNN